MARPSRVAELYAFDAQIRFSVASGFMPDVEGLIPDEQRPSAKALTAENAEHTENDYKKEGLLGDLSDEVKRPSVASGLVPDERRTQGATLQEALAGLDDSKRLSPKKREELFGRICALSQWGIGCASSVEIDRIGIVPALSLAARRAFRAMGHRVDLLLFDRGLSLRERPFVASGLVPDEQRPSAKALTAENAEHTENDYKKEGLLGDLCGERKHPSVECSVGVYPRRRESSQASCDATKDVKLAGFDEAGRGALAGPVVVACVHFPPFLFTAEAVEHDDKKVCFLGDLSDLGGERKHPFSKTSTAENAEHAEKDYKNKKKGFFCALGGEREKMEIAITKGDARSLHIAAASILAKVFRDRLMARYHRRFPGYGFDHNKGYGTAGHLAALRQLGPSPLHRRSFRVR